MIMKYKYRMLIDVLKRSILYKAPNAVLSLFFRDNRGVYSIYENIKNKSLQWNSQNFVALVKVCISLVCSCLLFPIVGVYYLINIFLLRRVYLPRIEVSITTFCSLKCKDCSNLMQFYDKPYHVSAEQVIASIERVLNAIDSLEQLVILGGEPFLHPEFERIINYANKHKKVRTV